MKLLHSYIARTILSATLLITLILVALYAFILFVDQLSDLGKGDYDTWHAMLYVLMSLPYQIYLFFPVACLLGALVGLGSMANSRELVVMRASGVSMLEMTGVVFKAAIFFIILMTLLGETCVPELSKMARDFKLDAMTYGKAIRTSTGVWVRDKEDFILLGEVHANQQVDHVLQFHFDEHHRMRWARRIEHARFYDDAWHATGVSETIFKNHHVEVRHQETLLWTVHINPLLLSQQNQSDEMSIIELHRYLKMNRSSKQSVMMYRYAYAERLVQPLTTLVMMLLSIPFIFGPLRSSTMGAKLLVGVSVGFGFHLINRFFGPVSQVLQWPPELSAVGPTVIFALFGFLLMKRTQ